MMPNPPEVEREGTFYLNILSIADSSNVVLVSGTRTKSGLISGQTGRNVTGSA